MNIDFRYFCAFPILSNFVNQILPDGNELKLFLFEVFSSGESILSSD